jgi:putative FmdB family regulatory protein
MPLYEYRCHKCGQVFEVLQKFADAPLDTHVACGGVVERLLSTPSFQFKGSGFYITDYGHKHSSTGSEKNNAPESNNGHSAAKTEKASSTARESKPSASSEPAAKR